jgi:hypothetical protein
MVLLAVDVLVYAHRAVSPRRSSRDCPPKGDARGNLVSDAWLAALAVESGCEPVTTDRG